MSVESSNVSASRDAFLDHRIESLRTPGEGSPIILDGCGAKLITYAFR
jgi:hypothetical protein